MNKHEYTLLLEKRSRRNKHPLTMQLELTPLCTLHCKMCYVLLQPSEVESAGGVLSTEKWLKIIDEAVDAGVLNITLTGGEAMLHPGFRAIYQRAYDKGLLVSIITNATLIDDDMADFLASRPPEAVCITLYGASPDTYERLCGNRAGYRKALQGIYKLLERHLKVSLQTTLTKDNIQDVVSIRNFALELNVPYTFNNYLSPYGQCSTRCVQQNEVSEEERNAVLLEINPLYKQQQQQQLKAAHEALDSISPQDLISCAGMRCGAGNNSFQVNWKGQMGLCTMLDECRIDIVNGALLDAWNSLVRCASIIPQIPECIQCPHTNCVRCIAAHYADVKQYGIRSERLCPVLQDRNRDND